MTAAPPTEAPTWWPYGLIAGIAIFVVAMLSVVIYLSTQRVDLVTPDYYARELAHQAQIDSARHARDLGETVAVELTKQGSQRLLVVQLPAVHREQRATGTIELYRPSDKSLDRRYDLQPDADGTQRINVTELRSGNWQITLRWRVDGTDYHHREDLLL